MHFDESSVNSLSDSVDYTEDDDDLDSEQQKQHQEGLLSTENKKQIVIRGGSRHEEDMAFNYNTNASPTSYQSAAGDGYDQFAVAGSESQQSNSNLSGAGCSGDEFKEPIVRKKRCSSFEAVGSNSPGAAAAAAAGLAMAAVKDKTCTVCGDKALGYNFNAISCESCKAFFRRNAAKEIRGRCEGKCEVTVESRSYCKRCRLQKCFAVGMKRELILSEQQKQMRCRKIRENRIRRLGGSAVPDDGVSDIACQTSSDSAAAKPESTQEVVKPSEPLTHVIASVVSQDVLDGMPEWCCAHLKEIIHAFQITFDRTMEHQPVAAPSNTEFLNMADTSVKRLVKMAKHLSHFRSLEQEDQILLLKGAVVEVLVLRSSKMFNAETMAWQVNKEGQQHSVSAMSLKLGSPESMAFILQYRRFVESLLRSTRCDNIVLMLLIVMTVFAPDRARMSSISLVSRIQEEYSNVLREYVTLRYQDKGSMMFARIMYQLTAIRDLNEKHTSMLMNMKVDDLEPLIIEIFDL